MCLKLAFHIITCITLFFTELMKKIHLYKSFWSFDFLKALKYLHKCAQKP